MRRPSREDHPRDARSPGHPRDDRPLVLVVEDHPDTLSMLEEFLLVNGCRVLVATDGEEALAIARIHSPSVVLLDLAMPRLSGNEVARRIREEGLLPNAVLVATTGRTSVTCEELALESGCDHVVLKPYDMTKILAIVRRGC